MADAAIWAENKIGINALSSIRVVKSHGYTKEIIFYFASQLVGADGHEYHFKHKTLPHARSRRSLMHTRVLKSHPSVSITVL